jgi:hypothetical protein
MSFYDTVIQLSILVTPYQSFYVFKMLASAGYLIITLWSAYL